MGEGQDLPCRQQGQQGQRFSAGWGPASWGRVATLLGLTRSRLTERLLPAGDKEWM